MGTDKALIEMGGQTLITRAIDFCRTFCDEILISSNIPGHKVEGLQLINDEINDCGPMGGIYSCLKQSTNEWNFVLSVDSPFVTTEFVSFLLTKKDGYNAVVPVHKNGKEPLIALYHKFSIIWSFTYTVCFLMSCIQQTYILTILKAVLTLF